jgi:hypothetical protein
LLGLIVGVGMFGCRLQDFIVQFRSTPTPEAVVAEVTATETATEEVTQTPFIVVITATPLPATNTPVASATRPPAPTRIPPTATRVMSPTPAPTPTSAYYYRVSFSYCGPNFQTYVFGTVRDNSMVKDGVRVRLSDGYGGPAMVNDYVTGTDRTKPGGYTQFINVNAPHGGLWYVWIVDDTGQQISDIATVKTDAQRIEDTATSAGSCQSAQVDFSHGAVAPPTMTPYRSPTRSGTPPTNTPTRTSTTTATATPTITPTP